MPSLLPQAGLAGDRGEQLSRTSPSPACPRWSSVVGKLGRAESRARPGAHRHDGEHHHPQARGRLAARPGRALVLRLARLAQARRSPGLRAEEHRQITKGEILTELQEKTAIPGVLPTFLQPIQTRLVMLQTGFRAMMGVKIYGVRLEGDRADRPADRALLKEVPGATDIVADRIVGKPYSRFEIDRDRIARYGVNIRDVQDVIEIAHRRHEHHGIGRRPRALPDPRALPARVPRGHSRSLSRSACRPARARRCRSRRCSPSRACSARRRSRASAASRRLRHHEHARPRRG